MKRNRVNVLTVVNSASNITTETIDGKPHIVVRGITPVVDDIVMNRRFYPSAEIEKAYNTLERNPMPLGHPKIDGKHVSARDVRAVNNYHVGAWLQNVQHGDGKVTGDMYVDRRYAEATDKGQRLINRLDAMESGENVEPIHISTGLMYSGIAANGESRGKKYREIATNMQFDHVAVLLDEPGAGTPEEGVGIFVNSDGSESEIEVVNLDDAGNTPDSHDEESLIKKLVTALFSANSKEEVDPMKEIIINALKEAGKATDGMSDEQLLKAYNEQQAADAKAKADADEKARKDKEELDKKAKETAANAEEAPAWFKPFADDLAAVKSGLAVNSDKEKTEQRAAVKAKFGMTDVAVNALDGEPLKELFSQCQTSIGLNGAYRQVNNNESFSEMPE